MMPAIAEVVPVPEALDAVAHQVGEGDAFFGKRRIDVDPDIVVRDAVLAPVDVELVQVGVEPSHGGVQRAVQFTEVVRGRHFEASPDRRLGADQRDLQGDDGVHAGSVGSPATIVSQGLPRPLESHSTGARQHLKPSLRTCNGWCSRLHRRSSSIGAMHIHPGRRARRPDQGRHRDRFCAFCRPSATDRCCSPPMRRAVKTAPSPHGASSPMKTSRPTSDPARASCRGRRDDGRRAGISCSRVQ